MMQKLPRLLRRAWAPGEVRLCAFCVAVSVAYALLLPTWEMAADAATLSATATTEALAAVALSVLPVACVMAVWRWAFAVAWPLFVAVSVVCAYAAWGAGCPVSGRLIDMAVNNNASLAADYVNLTSLSMMAGGLAFAAACVWVRWRMKATLTWHGLPLLLVALAVVAKFTVTGNRFIRPGKPYMPQRVAWELAYYLDTAATRSPVERRDFAQAPECMEDSVTVVLIIGESVRADHLGMNGYQRQTTPLLAAEPNLVSLPDMYDIDGTTHLSVPALVTRGFSSQDPRWGSEHSFLQLLRMGGFYTDWLANQDEMPTTRELMRDGDTLVHVEPRPQITDRWLMEPYRRLLRVPAPRKALVVHTIGSHLPYDKSPYECPRRIWAPSSWQGPVKGHEQEIINAYDNSIVHTDSLLHRMLEPLRGLNAVVVYCSDHGENLGEGGNWVHAADNQAVHHPAAWVWLSDTWAARHPRQAAALRSNAAARLHNSVVFHTVVDAAGVRSAYLDTTLSLLRPRVRRRNPRLK